MNKLQSIVTYLKKRTNNFQPRLVIILGSGFGNFATQLQDQIIIPYTDIPHFPVSTAPDHAGNMIFATFNNLPIMCLQGRVHRYEGAHNEDFKLQIRACKLLGCTSVLVTNASGSLHANLAPKSIVLIKDHINFQHINPLIGENDEKFGPRFPDMNDVYNKDLRQKFQQAAQELNIDLREVVNFSVMGPCFETASEIRAYKTLGGDIVNMSTVPEVIVAHHCGLKVIGLSIISNFATGVQLEKFDHSKVVNTVDSSLTKFTKLLENVISKHAILF